MEDDRRHVICFTEKMESPMDPDKPYRRGWLRVEAAYANLPENLACVNYSRATNLDTMRSTHFSRKLLEEGKQNIYSYFVDSVTDDFEAEKLSVQYYSEEEYQELIGGPSPEEVDKLQEQVLGPPRRDHKALASHMLNLLFPDGVSIKDTEWHGYNALIGLVNGVCSYCVDLQRGGGGVITLMDIMKDTKTLLQMEGYQIGKPDEKESEKDHGLHIQDTE